MGEKIPWSVSVRELAEFVWLRGDLHRDGGTKSSMRQGAEGHRKLQRSRPDNYKPEVYLADTVKKGDFSLTVSGRADGIFIDTSPEALAALSRTKPLSCPQRFLRKTAAW